MIYDKIKLVVNTPLDQLKIMQKHKIISREIYRLMKWFQRVQCSSEYFDTIISWHADTMHCPVVESALWAMAVPSIVARHARGACTSNAMDVCSFPADNTLHAIY